MTLDEAGLIQEAARGNREAFDALVGPRWPRMVRIAFRITGNEEDARDVAQQACLRLWTNLDRFRPGEDLDGWIYRIVVNLALDSLRRHKARPDRGAAELPPEIPSPDRAAGPEAALLARELERAFSAVTAGLPPRQKAVFVLARVEGMNSAQIAGLLGITESTVRNTLFQARAAVSRKLRERFPGLLGQEGP